MKLEKFEFRGINLDNESYSLIVNYPYEKINDKDNIKFKSFKVYHCRDEKVRKFVVNGSFTNKKVNNEDFSFVVEQIKDKEYNTSYIETVFFNNRHTITGLIQAFFNGQLDLEVFKEPEPIIVEEPTNFVDVPFDEAFIEEDITPISSSNVVVPLAVKDPIIIVDKATAKNNAPAKKGGRPKKTVTK